QDPRKGFLPDILDRFPGFQARAQLEADELAEVGHEVLFGAGLSAFQSLQVGLVKSGKLQPGPLTDRGDATGLYPIAVAALPLMLAPQLRFYRRAPWHRYAVATRSRALRPYAIRPGAVRYSCAAGRLPG